MSRIGKEPIQIPDGIKVALDGRTFSAEGPKGRIELAVVPEMTVTIDDGTVTVARQGNSGPHRARHGMTRALLANAVQGAAQGFTRQLEINGVGYRAEVKGREVHLALGYSHPVVYAIPDGVDIEIDKNNKITIQGADKQLVGQVAAEIRALRKPEPYKGKGIKYVDEVIRRKAGKAGAAQG